MRRVLLLAAVLGSVLAVPAIAQAATCVKPKHAVFAHGVSPSGEKWSAGAGIKQNRGCPSWLFEVEFNFSSGFSWGTGTEIPFGGHSSRYENVEGYAGIISPEATKSAAFGYAGPEMTAIRMKMSDGASLEVTPRFPPEKLRRKFVWMRGFRYFVGWYPGTGYVKELWAFNRAGTLVYRNLHAEGELG